MNNENEFQIENVFGDLVHYYEIRMVALSDYSTRTWNRFNWFMTIHLASFGFIFSSLVKVEESQWYFIVSIVVGITALVWAILGFEDFKQMQRYGFECRQIENKVLETLKVRESIEFSKVEKGISILPFKQTRLLYLFPLLVFVSWVLLSASV